MRRAVVVSEDRMRMESLIGTLTATGYEAASAASVADARALLDGGATLLVVDLGSRPWEGERSAPIATMPGAARRGIVVALVVAGLQTGDGSRAFLLGVDLVLSPSDAGRLGELVSAAVAAKRALVAPLDPAAAARLGA